MWATLSSEGADARYNKRPLHLTSQPADVAKETVASEETNARTVISDIDTAKIRKDSETAIRNDKKSPQERSTSRYSAIHPTSQIRVAKQLFLLHRIFPRCSNYVQYAHQTFQ